MQRIIIVINKTWETDAALAALFNVEFRKAIPNWESLYKDIVISCLNYPWDGNYSETKPRAIFTKGDFQIELWCLNSVMTKNPDDKDNYYYSRASQKAKDFPRILNFSTDPVKLLIAFGTAGVPTEVSKNGGIVVGSNVFPYDAQKEDATKRYDSKQFGQVVGSSISSDFFNALNLGMAQLPLKLFFEKAALATPNSPNNIFPFIADRDLVAIGDINTKSYDDFKSCDVAAVNLFNDQKKQLKFLQTAYSVDTTHSLVRLEGGCDKFIFISAITDRLVYFDNEVTPRVLAQNFSASFNGGCFLSWFIPYCFSSLTPLI